MSIVLGLDVSTSVTGLCILDTTIHPDDSGSHIILLDRIEFLKCNTMWDKADTVQRSMLVIFDALATGSLDTQKQPRKIDRIVLEEPLMGFRPGMSSAQTITTLMRFNGIVSYIVRNVFKCEPEYVSSSHARKLCGIKLQKTAVGGPQKEQVFSHMSANDLKHVNWPKKKSGKIVDWSRDACDAYVIARAAQVNGRFDDAQKKKKGA